MMALGARLDGTHRALELAFYVAAGFAWLWPARALLHWMARDDQESKPGSERML